MSSGKLFQTAGAACEKARSAKARLIRSSCSRFLPQNRSWREAAGNQGHHGVRLLGCHVKNGSFSSSSMNCMSIDSIIKVFYHLDKMLIIIMVYLFWQLATKHIADNNFVFL